MNLASPRVIRDLLASHGLHPRHALGQNFLIDRNILDLILDTASPGPGDHVLEVGPGLGILTEGLMDRAGHVTAVEQDEGLYRILRERWGRDSRLTLRHGDAVDLDYAELEAAG